MDCPPQEIIVTSDILHASFLILLLAAFVAMFGDRQRKFDDFWKRPFQFSTRGTLDCPSSPHLRPAAIHVVGQHLHRARRYLLHCSLAPLLHRDCGRRNRDQTMAGYLSVLFSYLKKVCRVVSAIPRVERIF